MNWIVITAIVATVLTGGGVGVAYAADDAVPGDFLYGVDIAVEGLRFALTLSQEAKVQLALQFADERLAELEELVGKGASAEAMQKAVQELSYNLAQAEQAMLKIAAGDGEQQINTLQLQLQERISLQVQTLNQLRDQGSSMNGDPLEQALRIMQTTMSRIATMLQQGEGQGTQEQGEQGGPPEEGPGGPSDDSPQGPPEDSPGGTPEDAGQGAPPEDAGQGSEGNAFDEGLSEMQFQVSEMHALVNQGEFTELQVRATEYGNWIDKLTQLIAEAVEEDPEYAESLALLLEDALAGNIVRFNTLMSSAPEDAHGILSQAIAASENGHALVAGMFGHGSHEGQQGPGGPTGEPPKGGN